jgi:hypothetical protein
LKRIWWVLPIILLAELAPAQTVGTFEGIDASQVAHPEFDVDPNGAIGTKQYLEWTNVYFQAFDKTTHAPIWPSPQSGTSPFEANLMTNCENVNGDGLAMFDRLASRWILAMRSQPATNVYYYCVAVSSTDDLSSSSLSWYTYEFNLTTVLGANAEGNTYWPDWPKFGTWPDAYYVSFDLNDVNLGYKQIGVVVCALDRNDMLNNAATNPMQCFSDPSPVPTSNAFYLKHSLIPADVNGTTAPPAGRTEYLVSIQNPVHDGVTKTSNSLNLWAFHVDWTTPANSTFTNSSVTVPTYTPGCYDPKNITATTCVPEPSTSSTGIYVDSVGDRFMPRLDYRNFGTYESFLVSHTVQAEADSKQTAIRWYEFRGSGVPALYQSGTVNPNATFRFMPSIAQDSTGRAAVGYNVSSRLVHPSIKAAWWNLNADHAPTEILIYKGLADEENSVRWGDYSSMTVDPVDGCTFWYVTEYFAQNETGNEIIWNTRIGHFRLSTCP